MCYYKSQKIKGSDQISLKHLHKPLAQYELFTRVLISGFDYGGSAVLKKQAGQQDFDVVEMEWGFIPGYIKDRESLAKMRTGYKDASGNWKPGIVTLNAVCEEFLQPGKIYRQAGLQRKCLVVASGFYEWRHVFPLNKKTGQPLKTANKYPYFISVKDRPYFFMAGIWQPWTDQQTGEYVESFSILTCPANELMQQVHNTKKRMPVILDEDQSWEWLFGNGDENTATLISASQFPAAQMQAYPIAKDFRASADPAQPFSYEELTPLDL